MGFKFLKRVFSEGEIQYCEKHVQSSTHYGARFAAKESFLKALGIGLGMGVKLKEIEVVHDKNGKPELLFAVKPKLKLKKEILKKFI